MSYSVFKTGVFKYSQYILEPLVQFWNKILSKEGDTNEFN